MKVVGSRGTWIVWVFVFFIWEPKWWLLFSSFTMGSDQNHLPWDLTRILPIKNRFFCLSTIFFHVLFSSHLWKVFWRWCNFWDLGKLGKVFWRRILECKTSPRMPVSTRIVKFLRFGDPYEHSLSTGIHGGGTGTSLKYVLSACLPSPCLPTMQAMVIAVLHARPTSAGVWCGVTLGSGMKFADFTPEIEQQAAPENGQISMPKGSRNILT